MSDLPFEVYPYDIDRLTKILAGKSGSSIEHVQRKVHRGYLEEYLGEFRATTILVENQYVDHDYLEDFARYYVKCFHKYPGVCTRVHFFTSSFDDEHIISLLTGTNGPLSCDDLRQHYLGFLVVKPIPETFIGRTCLRTYPPDGGRRHYPTKRKYSVHLFGLTLNVDSIAFQEQDKVVAACATSALWSAFQATGMLFHHSIPSPVEITQASTVAQDIEARDETRSIPFHRKDRSSPTMTGN